MMRPLIPAGFVLAVWVSGAAFAAQEPWSQTFDQDRPDQPPVGFSLTAMRQSDAGRWTIQRQGTQGYMVHHATAGAKGYAMAVADVLAPNDVAASVRLRFVGTPRVGGVVWRYQDSQNFYALILDLTERDLAIYRVASGNRIRLDVEDGLELDPEAWHVLKVSHVDSDIHVSLGGIRVFEERDRRDDQRSTQPGRAGVLAGGHSEVWFDDFHVDPKRGRR